VSGPAATAVRQIMDEVYRLFDRRCRTDTALAKLERLRQRVKRYRSLGRSLDKLKSPNLEKALVFLDESLLDATSNAVERANRRVRKMQKSVYRVRTEGTLIHDPGDGVCLFDLRFSKVRTRCRTVWK
jgi:hypothetical protein